MIKNDYILDQIDMLVKTLAKIVFKDKDDGESILFFKSEEIGLNISLYDKLISLVIDNNIDKAEDLLFEEIEDDASIINLNTAISFYNYLNQLPLDKLKLGDFSKEEIKEGFSEVVELYKIVDILV